MSQDAGSKIIKFGKYIGVVYPDVYFQFVSKLYKEHPDLIRGMVLAQVKLEDGSARDYLNMIFGTNVPANAPMEEGFGVFYEKLCQRSGSRIISDAAIEAGKDRFAEEHKFMYRAEENIGKPIFDDAKHDEKLGDKKK